jgi:hypothetical protein
LPAASAEPAAPVAATSATAAELGLHRPDFGGALISGAKVGAVIGAVPKDSKVSYQWLRNGKAIKGATHKSYKLANKDVRADVAVKVSVTAPGKAAVTQTSVAREISAFSKSVKPQPVSIQGTAAVGATLTAKAGKWSPKGTWHVFRWTRNGSTIAGADGGTYKVTDQDAGKSIGLVVRGRSTGRGPVVAIAPAKAIPAPPAPAPAPPAPAPAPPAPAPAPPAPPAPTPPAPTPPAPTPPAPPAPDPGPVTVPEVATGQAKAFEFEGEEPAALKKALMAVTYTVPTWKDSTGADVPALVDQDKVLFTLIHDSDVENPLLESQESSVADLITWGILDGNTIVVANGLQPAQLTALTQLSTGKYTLKMTVTKDGYSDPLVATFVVNWTNTSVPLDVPEVVTGQTEAFDGSDPDKVTPAALAEVTYTVPEFQDRTGAKVSLDGTDSVTFSLASAEKPDVVIMASGAATVAALTTQGVLKVDGTIVLAKGLTEAQLEGLKALPTGEYIIKMTVTKPDEGAYRPFDATFEMTWTGVPAPEEPEDGDGGDDTPTDTPSGTPAPTPSDSPTSGTGGGGK